MMLDFITIQDLGDTPAFELVGPLQKFFSGDAQLVEDTAYYPGSLNNKGPHGHTVVNAPLT
jgi:hypothetical protein